MSPVSTIGPSAGVAPLVPNRPAPAPVAEAVATDLAPEKTVSAVNTSLASRNDTTTSSELYQRSVILDPATQELVFRTIDVRSRQVIRQTPEQAVLRMQAYARALDQGKSTTEALMLANLEI